MESSNKDAQIHIVMFPWFGFGHISPFIQLSNKLSSHGFRISFLSAPGNISRIQNSLALSPTTQIIPLSIPSVPGLPPGIHSTADIPPRMEHFLQKAVDLLQPQCRALLSSLKPHFVIFDFAHHWIPKLASEFGIKSLFFSVFTAISGAFNIVPARLNGKVPTLEDLMKPPRGFPLTSITSLQPFQARFFNFLFLSPDGGPNFCEKAIGLINDCTAAIIKTCNEMEEPYVDYWKTQYGKQALLSGPLVPDPPSGKLDEKWAKWLDQFPAKSVIFCSFGSESYLNKDEIEELVLGFELTGLPFFLVLNFPAEEDARAKLEGEMPEGFLERVKDRGAVHTGWVPQQQILAHENVGCYLCHSGYSSLIESLINECQLVLLPLKGDQFLNSKLMSGDMKAGVEVKRGDEDGYFGKKDILEAVKTVMVDVEKEPGKTIRANHRKWREFLLNKEIQDKFIVNLVEQLKAMA